MLPTHCPQGHEYTEDNIARKSDGSFGGCRICSRIRSKAWRVANPERFDANVKKRYAEKREEIIANLRADRKANPDKYREFELKKKYGITLANKRKIFAEQGEKCAACGSSESNAKYSGEHGWPLDHDHVTGKIRGILCQPCNTTLGYSKESIERLQSLINYLQRHSN